MKSSIREQRAGSKQVALHRRLLPVLVAGCFGTALANPLGPQVVNGQASFLSQGNVLSVTNTPGTIINWQSFSINPGELTRFIQQNSNSAVLNRITGQDPSQILGALQSNGRVFLINPNGILFGQGAQVDVNGLVASTLNIGNDDFLNGKMLFKAGDKAGNLKNQGAITTPAGGQVVLIAPSVENSGIITSPKGDVMLAAGHTVQLVDSLNPDLRVVLSAPENEALNLGQVITQGGRTGIVGALVKQRGIVNADSAVVGENGKVVLKASRDTLLEAGSRTTATGAGKGGEIQVLGERVGLSGDAKVDASGQLGGGTVLVGGDYQGKNPEIQNAKRTYVGKDVEIRADAINKGDGGKVIVWSDEDTRASGAIRARGGKESGNGGFAEVSGKQHLDFASHVDLGAANGRAGSLLLDPFDIEVKTTGGSATLADFDVFADLPATGASLVSAAAISGAGTNVVLQATNDILFTDAVNIAAAGVGLTAQAGNNITVANSIATNGGAVSLSANDSGGPASGNGTVTIGGAISTNGGNVTVDGTSVMLAAGGSISAGAAIVNINANKAGGAITLQGGSSIAINGVNQTKQVNLKADNVAVGGTINATTLGQVTVTPYTPARDIELADAKSGTKLELTNADIANISAFDLTLSTSGAGSVTAQTTPISINGITNFYLNSTGDISIDRPLTQSVTNGLISLTTGTNSAINIGANGAMTTNGINSQIYLRSNNMTLGGAPGTINAGSGAVRFTPFNNATAINIGIGASDSVGSVLGLTDTELKTVATSGKLEIGNRNFGWTGDTTVVGALDLTGASLTGALGIQSGVGAGNDVTVNYAVKVPGELSVTATDMLAVAANGELQTTGATSAVTLTADRMNLLSAVGKIAALNGTIWVKPATSGWKVDIGSATDAASNTLEFSTSELNTFSGSGVLRIGSTTAGNLELKGPLAPTGFLSTGAISLQSGGTISQATSADIITADKLAVKALGGVTLNQGNLVNNVAAQIGDSTHKDNSFKFNNAAALNVASGIDALSGIFIERGPDNYDYLNPNGFISLASSGVLSQSDNTSALLSGKAAYLKGSSVNFGSTTAGNKLNSIGVIAGEATAGSTATFSYKSDNPINVSAVPNPNSASVYGISVPGATAGNYVIKLHSPSSGRAGVSQQSDAPIASTGGLLVDTIGTVSLGAANQLSAIKSTSSSGTFTFNNSRAAGWDLEDVTTGNQPIVINSSLGSLNVKGDVNAGTGNVTMVAPNLAVDTSKNISGATVTLTANSVEGTISQAASGTITGTTLLSLIADNLSINGTLIGGATATGGHVALMSYAPQRDVEIAGSGATGGTLSVTQAILNRINPSGSNVTGGSITIGSEAGGALTFKGNFTSPGGMYPNVYGTSIGQAPGTIINGGLHAVSTGAITLNEPGNQINSLGSVFTADSGISVVTNVSSLSLFGNITTDSGGISITNSGGSIIVGNAQVSAGDGSASLSAPTGDISIHATTSDAYIRAYPDVNLTVGGNLSFSNGAGYKAYVTSLIPATTHLTFNNTTGKVLFNGAQATGTTSGNMGFFFGGAPGAGGSAAVVGSSLLLTAGDPANFTANAGSSSSSSSSGGTTSQVPSLNQCTSDPTLAGCTNVLPALATCVSAPSTAGCSVVLPTLDACSSDPAKSGCSAVLPTLSTCTTAPTTTGCSAVLPTLSICAAAPTTAGCSAVLPSVSACVTDPAAPGCSSVLPALEICATAPTTAGCSVVLPSLNTCTASPSAAGCSAVLPSMSICTAAPTTAGCNAVLPSLAACTTSPGTAGCSAVLPSVSTCTTAPTTAGCSAILPTLATCATAPTTAGCSAVLPTINACTATPTLAGCAAVLPTLAQCVGNPSQEGCAAVLPAVSICVVNPTAAGCQTVLPTTGTTTTTNTITQTVTNTSNTIVTVSVQASTNKVQSGSGSSSGGTSSKQAEKSPEKSDEKKEEKKTTSTADDSGAKKNEPVKKLYCN